MWTIYLTHEFECWLARQPQPLQEDVLAALGLLKIKGPHLGRPYADTLKGSRHAGMKELRVQHAGRPIRAFYAFDPHRYAIMLCAAQKKGDEKRFYRVMLRVADKLFSHYLNHREV
ncbi:type II toxin-antitoxin system RelE/ParE family toxin [Cronobacter sakazakii]|uniref:type II toxin-antitoxin system RelE/ParE family toxin n=1 Tax=Cronobacter sakazakii TaxID=28141 RepID=UPI000CFACF2E|nr:type II toxin-antitoxin system RelE/ParE family toxin [Cronobacter sakazakii]ELY2509844.1 type II toxin-antitoxin system RelE/ParE family toxin [Cronobacter sakazakii]ELY2630851.1 type II toxin-antitoxin system RelE/ParE family toxin [Cronobacter sakazakii]ELY2639460.1 type II toxin-antitoxin system RelE/ParE family toxin [Cronobacter sakazakii]ELY2659727.1 type II toxin-antitoxin system RelE/ParE family toxin [Cronobacter sakazakii]ELY4639228.1 type II toxin-antitoxin system RelE/ParE fami